MAWWCFPVLGRMELFPTVVRFLHRQPAFVSPAYDERAPNKRLKLSARVNYGMNLSSARRSLSAIR
jgi:hypothetical protein